MELTRKLLYLIFTTLTHVYEAYQISDSFLHALKRPPSTWIMAMRRNALHRNNFPNCVGLAYT